MPRVCGLVPSVRRCLCARIETLSVLKAPPAKHSMDDSQGENEAGPSSERAGPSSRHASRSSEHADHSSGHTSSGYLDDADPNLKSSLDIYSRIHKQTIERVRTQHEREYASRTDDIDYGDTPDPHLYSDVDDEDARSDTSSELTTSSVLSRLEREREEQFQEAIDQLELTFRLIVCPLFGKWMGRKWAYWGE